MIRWMCKLIGWLIFLFQIGNIIRENTLHHHTCFLLNCSWRIFRVHASWFNSIMIDNKWSFKSDQEWNDCWIRKREREERERELSVKQVLLKKKKNIWWLIDFLLDLDWEYKEYWIVLLLSCISLFWFNFIMIDNKKVSELVIMVIIQIRSRVEWLLNSEEGEGEGERIFNDSRVDISENASCWIIYCLVLSFVHLS
jgi:hypothetical protein